MNVSFSGIRARLIFTIFLFQLLMILPCNVAGQEGYLENGYYVSLENDTVFGNLTNQDGMYLVCIDSKGKKHKFSPSSIKGFCLDHQEYTSLFIHEMNSIRYVAIKGKGYYTLLQYDFMGSYSTYGQMGLMGGAVEGTFKARNSGYFVIKKMKKDIILFPVQISGDCLGFETAYF